MNYTLAKYTVRPETLKAVKKALRELAAQVQAHEPRTFYCIFREGSTSTFYHLMSFPNEAAQRKHAQSRYVDRFVKRVYPWCLSKPIFLDLKAFATAKRQWVLQP